MALKALPGIGIALALGIFFNLPEKEHTRSTARKPSKWSVDSARCDAAFDALQSVAAYSISRGLAGKTAPVWTSPVLSVKENIVVVPAHQPQESLAYSTPFHPAPQSVEINGDIDMSYSEAGEQVAEVASATAFRKNETSPSRSLSQSREKPSSRSRYEKAFCEDETSGWIPASAYPNTPVRGLETWASAMHYTSKQKENEEGKNIYGHTGDVYSFGIRQDWTIDSVVGVSMDILDANVRGRYDNDNRKNEITGYFANAHYNGTFLGKYPVEFKGTYGRIYHEGRGDFTSNSAPPITAPWYEDRHRSHYYGFYGKAGVPLLFSGTFKVLPEIGVDWRKIKTSRYTVDVDSARKTPHYRDDLTSKSLMVPLTLTVKRDFKQCWGLVTPRAKLGYIQEFEDTASGVRAFNSEAASRPKLDFFTEELARVEFDQSQKKLYEFGAGLDIRTVGGWDFSADYNRRWASQYNRDEFKVELGRCF